MSAVTTEELLRITHRYYPGPGPEPWQLTPEYHRFQEAWSQAVESEPWEELMRALEEALPGHDFGCYTPAGASACYLGIVYLKRPRLEEAPGYRLLRVAGAVSLIAPVYLVYATSTLVTPLSPQEQVERAQRGYGPRAHHEQPQLFLHPPEELESVASTVARVIERTSGHRPFPVELAGLTVPGLRVPFLNLPGPEEPTLLQALFIADPANLL